MTLADPLSLVGTTVSEKYEIERVVGEGGFAVVYRAMHRVWQRPVALKVFRALGDLAPDKRAGLVEAFIQEGRLLADLSERSAAICQARDVGTLTMPDGRSMPYMVLEWLEGRTLEAVIESENAARGTPRTVAEAVRLLEPVAEALALAHKKGIAHRDVKPANIFVLGDPRGEFSVKLLDFGIAKVVQDAQRLAGSFAQTSGQVSSFTPLYGAPEQFSRAQGATGPWTDVFALALIFTELLTHKPPLAGDDLTQLAFSAMDPQRRPTPRTLGATVPDAFELVMRRALAVDPKARFQNMGQFWDAVRTSLGLEPLRSFSMVETSPDGVVASGTALRTAPTPRPAPKGGVLVAVLAVGTFVALGAVAGFFALKSRRPVPPPIASAPASTSAAAIPPPPAKCPAGMAKIPGGKFFMGSDDRTDEKDERPAHQVTLSPYCMDQTEVTVEAYKACSDKGECKRAPKENEWDGIDKAAHDLYDPLCNIRDPEGKAKHPINCLDWGLANAYCVAVGKRLPTEAEWEYATRGSDGRRYPWGDDPPSTGTFLNACGTECVAWGKKHPDPNNPLTAMYNADDHWPVTAPVGSFPKGASPFGLEDVVGNVWEWVSDWYGPYTADAQTDPSGPASGTERSLRGGSWNGSNIAWVRPTFRFSLSPTLRSHGIGVRCAKSLP